MAEGQRARTNSPDAWQVLEILQLERPMKIERADYRNFAKAALLVTIVMSLLLLAAWRLSGVSQTTKDDFLLLLFLPGGLVVMPLIHNIHTSWPGYVFLGVAVNWILYTWATWALMEKRRQKRELRAIKSAVPPPTERVSPDQ